MAPVDGVKGYYATGKNGNSIFLPCYGYKAYGWDLDEELGFFWAGTIEKYNSNCGHYLRLSNGKAYWGSSDSKYNGLQIRPVYSPSSPGGITNITDYITIARTGSSSVTGWGTPIYKVTFKISNNSTETIHLSTLGGVTISTDLKGGDSYTVTLQASTSALQEEPQTLVFTYNGKFYSIKG